MSEIIKLIITFVLYFLAGLAISLPLAIFYTRKMDKLISNYFREIDESCAALDKSLDESRAARSQNLKEVHAQVDELDKSFDELDKSFDEIHQSLDSISESMDRTIEFKRLYSEYLDYKTKQIEARENFREPEFSDEKNIH